MEGNDHSVTVLLHREDGELWAEVEEYPGCFATGRDLDELQVCLAEALSLYLSTPDQEVEVTLDLKHADADQVESRRVQLCAA